MSWLYAQTWLWYLIAFVVGVLLAWLLLVRPQQRRLRTLEAVAGAGADHDLYADSRDVLTAGEATAAASGAALFASDAERPAAADPTTDRIPTVDAETGNLDTTELPVQPAQPAPDDSVTGEIPLVPAADRDGQPATSDPTDDSVAERNGQADAAAGTAAAAAAHAATDTGSEPDPADATPPESSATTGTPPDTSPIDTGADSESAPAGAPGPTDTAPTDTAPTDTAPTAEAGHPGTVEPRAAGATDAFDGGTESADRDRAGSGAADSGPGVQGLLAAPAATTTATAVAITAGPYRGSARPGPDGSAPGAEYTIKGNEDSMLFHTPDSPYYGRTKAEVWFSTVEDAEAAGFTNWKRKR